MPIKPAILDTDTLSELMKGNPSTVRRVEQYLKEHPKLAFTIITRYEILKGLKAKGATKQSRAFEDFCKQNIVLTLTNRAIEKASEIYADLKKRGSLLSDADILIASIAITEKHQLVTNNLDHFRRITDLELESWKD